MIEHAAPIEDLPGAQFRPSGELWKDPKSDEQYPACALCITLKAVDGSEIDDFRTKTNFAEFLKSLGAHRGAKVTSDGKHFFVQRMAPNDKEVTETVALALNILYAMDGFNADPLKGNRLEEETTASIIIHRDPDVLLIQDKDKGAGFGGNLLAFFLKGFSATLARGGLIVMTNDVHRRLNNTRVKEKFKVLRSDDNAVPDFGPFWSHSSVDETRLCRLATSLDDRLEQVFKSTTIDRDGSDLWYMLVHTEHYGDCARIIETEVDQQISNIGGIRDARVHSLLGSYELAVTYRASEEHCWEFARALENLLRGHLKKANDFLVLNAMHEFARPPREKSFTSSYRWQSARPLDHDTLRCVEGFITLQYTRPGMIEHDTEKHIHECVSKFPSIVRQYTMTGYPLEKARELGKNRKVVFEPWQRFVIEFLLPCGSYSSLTKFSTELEKVISDELVKMTFLAYKTYQPSAA